MAVDPVGTQILSEFLFNSDFVGVLQNSDFVGVLQNSDFVGVLQNLDFVGVLQNLDFVGVLQNSDFVGVLQNSDFVGVLQKSKSSVKSENFGKFEGIVFHFFLYLAFTFPSRDPDNFVRVQPPGRQLVC